MYIVYRMLLLCVLWVVGFYPSVGLTQDAMQPYHADRVMINLKDKSEHPLSTIYVDGFRMREELHTPDGAIESCGKTMVQIVDYQRKSVWVVCPDKHKYEEHIGIPIEPPPVPGDVRLCDKSKGVTCNKLGTENIGTRVADKWELIRTSRDGATVHDFVWVDQKLSTLIRREVPGSMLHPNIRQEFPEGMAMELRNIQEGAQPSSLFEVPADFQKMEPPAASARPPQGQPPQGQTQGQPH